MKPLKMACVRVQIFYHGGGEGDKEGHTVLEMRFPDNEAGWEHWRKLVETVRRFETGFSALIEEIEPGKLKAVIHLK